MKRSWKWILTAVLLAGCASEPPVIGGSPPSYLGLSPDTSSEWELAPAGSLYISPSKVLSANVFQRVTGHEVDPSRLVDR